jgi:hypothetical protein
MCLALVLLTIIAAGGIAAGSYLWGWKSANIPQSQAKNEPLSQQPKSSKGEDDRREEQPKRNPPPSADAKEVRVLTEDEKIGWEKVRRQHPKQSYAVAAYIPATKQWFMGGDMSAKEVAAQMFEPNEMLGFLIRSPNEHSAIEFTDIKKPEKSESERKVQIAERNLSYFKSNPTGAFDASKYDKTTIKQAILDEQQKTMRRLEADLEEAKRRDAAVPSVLPGLKRAQDAAQRAASVPSAKVIVLLDLYSKPAPFVVRWYFDDGQGVKQADKPPFPELEAKLASFLVTYQAKASTP